MARRSRIGRIAQAAAVTTAAAAGLATAASAQDDDELWYAESGLYLTGAANYMVVTQKEDIEDDVEDSLGGMGVSADAHDSWGMNFRLGYRIVPRVAVETQFEWVQQIEVDARVDGEKEQEQIALMALTGNAKAFLLTGRIQPYAVAGAGWGRTRGDPAGGGTHERDDGLLSRFGAGVDLYGNRDIALNLETSYLYAGTGQIKNLDYVTVSAGLMLRFYSDY